MSCKLATKSAKVEVIKTMWDMKLFTWLQKATKTKDSGMQYYLKKFQFVDPKIMDYILVEYIR